MVVLDLALKLKSSCLFSWECVLNTTKARPPSLFLCVERKSNSHRVHLGARGQSNKESRLDQGLWSASDLMIIGYPKGNGSNNGSREMYRAVTGMALRNPARAQWAQALPWAAWSWARAVGTSWAAVPALPRSLVQGGLKEEWASTFLP